MRALVLALFVSTAGAADPAAFGVIGGPGDHVNLYTEAGACTNGALRAMWVPREGQAVAGCWRLMTHDPEGNSLPAALIMVAYLDATARAYPAAWVRKAVAL